MLASVTPPPPSSNPAPEHSRAVAGFPREQFPSTENLCTGEASETRHASLCTSGQNGSNAMCKLREKLIWTGRMRVSLLQSRAYRGRALCLKQSLKQSAWQAWLVLSTSTGSVIIHFRGFSARTGFVEAFSSRHKLLSPAVARCIYVWITHR